mgnify:FL=1
MKKLAIVAAMAMAIASFTACGNQTKKGGLKTDVDSLSYAIGMEQSQGIQQYLQQLGVDSTYLDEFVKGLEAGANSNDDKKKTAYNAGVAAGMQMSMMVKKGINQQLFGKDSTKSVSMKQLIAGFKAGAKGKGGLMTIEQAQTAERTIVPRIQSQVAEKTYGANKKKSEAFMAKIAKQPGIKKLGKGVYYKVEKEGTGAIPTASQTVKIEYEGRTIDGKVFDSTKDKGAVAMPVGGVIPGFTEALTHMPVGSTWEIYIPYDAAYGSRQMSQDIVPFSALTFKVTLVSIEKENPAANRPAPTVNVK